MGIDIGTMTSIAQLGAPPSVSSLRQRLGRSGRTGGPAILRVYVAEAEVTAHTPPPDALRAQLVQSIAMVQLLLERWFEPPGLDDLHLSTLTQQVLSIIAQHGGVRPAEAYSALCAQVHDRVRQEMLAIYREPAMPAFLDATGRDLLIEARENFARYQLDQRT